MMNAHQLQLSREIATLPAFRSFKGMLLVPPPRPEGRPFDGRLPTPWRVSESSVPTRPTVLLSEGWLPDLSDEITVLGLVTLIRPAAVDATPPERFGLELDEHARGYLTETFVGVLTGDYDICNNLLGALVTALKRDLMSPR